MPNASLVKEAGTGATTRILTEKSKFHYPTEANGASTHMGNNDDELLLHYTGSPDLTTANQILTDISLPTCTSSGLTITVNVGAFIVADATVVTASGTSAKEFEVNVVIDDTTGALSVIVLEKEDGEEYAAIPAGKTFCCVLKEYSLIISGTTLVETLNRID